MNITRRTRQMLIKRIAAERSIPVADVVILGITEFKAADQWGSVGTVLVSYDPSHPDYRALYGHDALARVSCYMD